MCECVESSGVEEKEREKLFYHHPKLSLGGGFSSLYT